MTKQTSLFSIHQELGALIVDFAGWHMPLHYGSQIDEHHHVRNHAGMFDVSHMCSVDLKGADVKRFLSRLLANNIDKLKEPGQAQYGCMLNEQGGILDDLITYYLDPQSYRIVVNAGTTDKDVQWMKQQAEAYKLTVTPRTDLSMIAVQGPKARELAAQALGEPHSSLILNLKPFRAAAHESWLIARTGYTGEDGIEIMLPHVDAQKVWRQLLQTGVSPIGLGARDTLRLEAGLNLYGMDMDESVTPLQSNLAWTVAFEPEQRDFIGRVVLQRQKTEGAGQEMIGLVLQEKGVLRHGQKIYLKEECVGEITSGTFSPTLKHSIALARVHSPSSSSSGYTVDIRGKRHAVRVVKPPFVKNGKANFL